MKKYISLDDLVTEIDKGINGRNDWQFDDYRKGYHDALIMLKKYLFAFEGKVMDLENSMICKVGWYDGCLLDYTQGQQDELLEKIGANVGDKIRVILIKE